VCCNYPQAPLSLADLLAFALELLLVHQALLRPGLLELLKPPLAALGENAAFGVRLLEKGLSDPLFAPFTQHRLGGNVETKELQLIELRGWKQIAYYLKVSERTAKDWELSRNLPVHRLPGQRGRLFATAVELEAWKHGHVKCPASAARKGITVRLSETAYAKAKHYLSVTGLPTMQELMFQALEHYLESSLCRTRSVPTPEYSVASAESPNNRHVQVNHDHLWSFHGQDLRIHKGVEDLELS